ncbi:hypothetical protein [Bifidobacterium samirii]|uniref:Uncharacterized protein n=1 Tax=Bifidobacterium samirii TaxID=2306974 RepID=A0A430FVW6_9BIFI|nr:hypothetical protein [Bifidobacterium samirii]RSX58093.1 hypothetical protein D2E24_0453 [Bifidobacterium samirii]
MTERNTRGRTGARRTSSSTSARARSAAERRRQATYRRRRIVVGAVAVILLALAVFCGYALVRLAGSAGAAVGWGAGRTLEREAVPDAPKVSAVRSCTASDVDVTLAASTATVGVGGSVDFSITLRYTGSAKQGCLIDASDDAAVLTVSSGDQTIWRSDVCPADPYWLLLATGDEDTHTVTWNTVASSDSCVADADLPKVNAGTYVAALEFPDLPKLDGGSVAVAVQ